MRRLIKSLKSESIEEPTVIDKTIGFCGPYTVLISFLYALTKFSASVIAVNMNILTPKTVVRCSNVSIANGCSEDCPKRIIDSSPIKSSVTSEFELVCESFHISTLFQSLFTGGLLVGGLVASFLGDYFGRKWVVVSGCIIVAFSISVIGFLPWLWAILLMRFWSGLGIAVMVTTSHVLIVEFMTSKTRVIIQVVTECAFCLGQLTVPLIGYLIREWRYMCMAMACPCSLLLLNVCLLSESPRWLLAKGKDDAAIQILTRAAKCNHRMYDSIAEDAKKYASKMDNQKKGDMRDILRSKILMIRSMTFIVIGFSSEILTLGIKQYSGQLEGNLFLNITIVALMKIPSAILIYLMLNSMGRKITAISMLTLCSSSMFLLLAVPNNEVWPILLVAIATCSQTVFSSAIGLLRVECYPTATRNSIVGCIRTISFIGGLIAPTISTLKAYGLEWLTCVIFGLMGLVALVLMFFLPETRGIDLPSTIEEAEKLSKRNVSRNREDNQADNQSE